MIIFSFVLFGLVCSLGLNPEDTFFVEEKYDSEEYQIRGFVKFKRFVGVFSAFRNDNEDHVEFLEYINKEYRSSTPVPAPLEEVPGTVGGIWDKKKIQKHDIYTVRISKKNFTFLEKSVDVCDLVDSDFKERIEIFGKSNTKYVNYMVLKPRKLRMKEMKNKAAIIGKKKCNKKIRKKKISQAVKVKLNTDMKKDTINVKASTIQELKKMQTQDSGGPGGILGLLKKYWKWILGGLGIFFLVQILMVVCSGELDKMMKDQGMSEQS